MVRKTFKKRTTKKTTLAKKVDKLTKIVKLQKPEVKYYDVATSVFNIDNLPSVFIRPYTNITQGLADYGNRIGDKIRVNNFRLRTTWLMTGQTPIRVRMFAFIYKKNPDSVSNTWSTIVNLYLTSAFMNSAYAVTSYRDWDNNSSFHTLYDKERIINPIDQCTAGMNWDMHLSIPKAYQEVSYVAGGSTMSQNELFIGFIQEYDTNLTTTCHYRFTYTDV